MYVVKISQTTSQNALNQSFVTRTCFRNKKNLRLEYKMLSCLASIQTPTQLKTVLKAAPRMIFNCKKVWLTSLVKLDSACLLAIHVAAFQVQVSMHTREIESADLA